MQDQTTTLRLPKVEKVADSSKTKPQRPASIGQILVVIVGIFGLTAIVVFTSIKTALILQAKVAAYTKSQPVNSLPDAVAQLKTSTTTKSPRYKAVSFTADSNRAQSTRTLP
jgi:hypothetical protein